MIFPAINGNPHYGHGYRAALGVIHQQELGPPTLSERLKDIDTSPRVTRGMKQVAKRVIHHSLPDYVIRKSED